MQKALLTQTAGIPQSECNTLQHLRFFRTLCVRMSEVRTDNNKNNRLGGCDDNENSGFLPGAAISFFGLGFGFSHFLDVGGIGGRHKL